MSQGTLYYGLHFYPGVCRYTPAGREPYTVFINEDTIRTMQPSFIGRPVYVQHVDDVPDDVDEMRRSSDGLVVESFFNPADGMHWVKFLVCSERGERAIANGMRISNAYFPKRLGEGGRWNGIDYDQQVLAGEYEHLAIVPNPRYRESVVMTPDQFKAYNESKLVELKRLANNDDEGKGMKLNLFKRAKLENADSLADAMVELPTLKREISIAKLVNSIDTGDFQVSVDGRLMSINDLINAHVQLTADHAELKKLANADEEDAADTTKNADDDKEENWDDDESEENADDDEDEDDEEKEKRKKKEAEEKKENTGGKKKNSMGGKSCNADDDAYAAERRKRSKEAADRLRNARQRHDNADGDPSAPRVVLSADMVDRGRARYGSDPVK